MAQLYHIFIRLKFDFGLLLDYKIKKYLSYQKR